MYPESGQGIRLMGSVFEYLQNTLIISPFRRGSQSQCESGLEICQHFLVCIRRRSALRPEQLSPFCLCPWHDRAEQWFPSGPAWTAMLPAPPPDAFSAPEKRRPTLCHAGEEDSPQSPGASGGCPGKPEARPSPTLAGAAFAAQPSDRHPSPYRSCCSASLNSSINRSSAILPEAERWTVIAVPSFLCNFFQENFLFKAASSGGFIANAVNFWTVVSSGFPHPQGRTHTAKFPAW